MKLYVSGPMTGYIDHNFPAFNAAAEKVRSLGYEAVNPVDINTDTNTPWVTCLRNDLKALCDCEGIVMLPGWHNSTGAHLELNVAHRLQLPIFFIETLPALP